MNATSSLGHDAQAANDSGLPEIDHRVHARVAYDNARLSAGRLASVAVDRVWPNNTSGPSRAWQGSGDSRIESVAQDAKWHGEHECGRDSMCAFAQEDGVPRFRHTNSMGKGLAGSTHDVLRSRKETIFPRPEHICHVMS